MSDSKNFHVEFDMQFVSSKDDLIREIKNTYLPRNLVITEIESPIKVGDMIDDAAILARMPKHSVILDRDEDAWQKYIDLDEWLLANDYGKVAYSSVDLINDYGPVTVIYTPKESK
jgi:hypothetical protein